jgi:hypothetical protein
VRGDGDRHGGVDPRQLLDRDRVGDGVAARTAVLLRNRQAHQAELAELRYEVVGEARLAVQLFGDRRDLSLRELADGPADQLLLVAELEIQATSLPSSAMSRTPQPVPPGTRR